MPAYLIVILKVDGTDWRDEYVANVPSLVRRFGGEYLAMSGKIEQFEGEDRAPDVIAILTFPSLVEMKNLMNSPEYAPYKEARIAQSSATILGFETVPINR